MIATLSAFVAGERLDGTHEGQPQIDYSNNDGFPLEAASGYSG